MQEKEEFLYKITSIPYLNSLDKNSRSSKANNMDKDNSRSRPGRSSQHHNLTPQASCLRAAKVTTETKAVNNNAFRTQGDDAGNWARPQRENESISPGTFLSPVQSSES